MVVIIGAGLSGLLTAYRLKQEGIPFKFLEARDRIGGRIHTVLEADKTPTEMGATWFNEQHYNLVALLQELEIGAFEQYIDGSVFYQREANSPTEKIQIPKQSPSYRIIGGTSNLIKTLYQKLGQDEVLLNQAVTSIRFKDDKIQVIAQDIFEADKVVLAIPPKLWAKKIRFEPALPEDLITIAKQTHTWMEDSIKIALCFDTPFWQEEKIPATLFSNVGPITEFYDHCNYERSKFALCGFMNSSLKSLAAAERKAIVLNQLKEVFGPKVLDYIAYEEFIWSKEEFTFEASEQLLYPHQNNGNPIFSNDFFDGKLLISSAESAKESPGYMDGAVYAGNLTATKIIETL
jgi:monoamine oxidase